MSPVSGRLPSVPTETGTPYREDMPGDADIAAVAGLLADRSRAAICQALLDGRFRTAGELARVAGVAASTASEHLTRLLTGGLVEVIRQGRHRYYRLAGPNVAAAIEALGSLAPALPVRGLRDSTAGAALRAGRTCYDHLAGELGVAITGGLIAAGVLTPDLAVADLTPLRPIGVTVPPAGRRPLSRPCMDWTERCYHAAGTLPTALTNRLFQQGWLQRIGHGRAVRLTADGRAQLHWLLPAAKAAPSS
jgi:DNA-binding transcriptional ArsR family regulator